uniref:MUC5A protein n=1 Tax=Petromyzon marinus TaxID=7757 RepID=S4RTY7_PETMA
SQQAVCTTWGGGFFKTFDEAFFKFSSNCSYMFFQDCRSSYEEFNIKISHGANEQFSEILFKIDTDVAQFANGKVSFNNRILTLPFSNNKILIQTHGSGVKLAFRQLEISAYLNDDAFTVVAGDEFRQQLCGLCGNFDGSSTVTTSYSRLKMLLSFSAYEVLFFVKCSQLHLNLKTLPAIQQYLIQPKSSGKCTAVVTSSCKGSCGLNQEGYAAMCAIEKCQCGSATTCGCAALSAYSRECSLQYKPLPNWRSSQMCPPQDCPGNLEYQECGSTCPPTCANMDPSKCQEPCVAGCVCPSGTVLSAINEETCIAPEECRCNYNGITYDASDKITIDCNSCTCEAGSWTCTTRLCPKACSLESGAHFNTFDSRSYTFHGVCSYYLAVKQAHVALRALGQKLECSAKNPSDLGSISSLTDKKRIRSLEFKSNGKIISSQMSVSLPYISDSVKIFRKSSMFIQVDTSYGMMMLVQNSPTMQVYIGLIDSVMFRETVCTPTGLCGNFNGIASDDFMSSQGLVEGTAAAFANSWKVNPDCEDVGTVIRDPCQLNTAVAKQAELRCAILRNSTAFFKDCHYLVDPYSYYSRCKQDACSCPSGQDCITETFLSYALACASKGLIFENWRKATDSQLVECPNAEVYSYNANACNQTCRSLSSVDLACQESGLVAEGCQCAEGLFANDEGMCVPAVSCPCYVNGDILKPGEKVTIADIPCYCREGQLLCSESKKEDHVDPYPPPPVAIQNISTLVRINECVVLYFLQLGRQCQPGCICPEGLINNGNGDCVNNSPCSVCHLVMSGRKEQCHCGASVYKCYSGSWNCTELQCDSTCKMYGDGHYTTFDGQRFQFDGNCEYVVAQDFCVSDPKVGTFQIITENIPCGSMSTCSKSIRFFLQNKEIKLADGKYEIHDVSGSASKGSEEVFTVHTVGLYLIVKASNGIKLIWDRRTSLFIIAPPDKQNQLCGLCGKYNFDMSDDFTMRDHSLSASPLHFGNSWKASDACSDVTDEASPCEMNPYRKAWSERKCSILKTDVFDACHSQVDHIPFYEACVRDSCACNIGGDCECFCTSVAAYAEACTSAGQCVAWRTPDLCPVFCDYYNSPDSCTWHYRPCGIVNTKTCGNPAGIDLGNFPQLEGCYPKCPAKTPYLDEHMMTCVSMDKCSCEMGSQIVPANGTVVNRDTCETCTCVMGNMECVPYGKLKTVAHSQTYCVWTYCRPKATASVHLYTASSSTTPPSTTQESTTFTTGKPSTTEVTTPAVTITVHEPITTVVFMESWKVDNCTIATCNGGDNISYSTKKCSVSTKPKCRNAMMVKPSLLPQGHHCQLQRQLRQHEHPSHCQEKAKHHHGKHHRCFFSQPKNASCFFPKERATTRAVMTACARVVTSTTPPSTTQESTTFTTGKPSTTEVTTPAVTITIHEPITTVVLTTTTLSTAGSTPGQSTAPQSQTTSPYVEQTTTTPQSGGTPVQTTISEPDQSTSSGETSTAPLSTTAFISSATSLGSLPTTPETTAVSTTVDKACRSVNPPRQERATTRAVMTACARVGILGNVLYNNELVKLPFSSDGIEITSTISDILCFRYSLSTYCVSPFPASTTPPSTTQESTTFTTGKPSTTEVTTPAVTITVHEPITTVVLTTTTLSTAGSTPGQSTATQSQTTSPYVEQTTTTPQSGGTPVQTTISEPHQSTSSASTTPPSTTQESTTFTTGKPSTTEVTTPAVTITIHEPITTVVLTTTTLSTAGSTPGQSSAPQSKATSPYVEQTTTTPQSGGTPVQTTISEPDQSTSSGETSTAPLSTTAFISSATSLGSLPTTPETTAVSTTVDKACRSVNPPRQCSDDLCFFCPKTPTPTPTTPSSTTPPSTTQESTTFTTGKPSTTEVTTPAVTITVHEPITTVDKACRSVNPPRQVGEKWQIDSCTTGTCRSGNQVMTEPVVCLNPPMPKCRNPTTKPVKVYDNNGCCYTWKCNCQCQGWGDPHYRTFDGQKYTFLEDCTYTLVEEKINKYAFSVLVDNYYFYKQTPASFVRGITVNYNGNSANISLPAAKGRQTVINKVIFNGQAVAFPFVGKGFVITNHETQILVEIPAIGASVSFTGMMFTVDLPYSLFGNNTQGQCGTCNNARGDDCMRQSGVVEDASCCAVTAADWMVPDASKPHCRAKAPTGQKPCPSTTPTTRPYCTADTATICDIITSNRAFAGCAEATDLSEFFDSCVYDTCAVPTALEVGCASLQVAAEQCAALGFYVDWRSLTRGMCQYNCSSGFEYQPIGPKEQLSCDYSGATIQTSILEEGCFCPKGMKMFNSQAQTCVVECGCMGPQGKPVMFGNSWQSDCKECVCDKASASVRCAPNKCPENPEHSCKPWERQELVTVDTQPSCCPIYACGTDASRVPRSCGACGWDASEITCCPNTDTYMCSNENQHGQLHWPIKSRCGCSGVEYCHCRVPECGREQSSISANICLTLFSVPRKDICLYKEEMYQFFCKSHIDLSPFMQIGQTWNKPGNNCTQFICTSINELAVVEEKTIVCKEFDITNCIKDTVTTDEYGCCKTCSIPKLACRIFEMDATVSRPRCEPKNITLSTCEGTCASRTYFDTKTMNMASTCDCCKPQATEERTAVLDCKGVKTPIQYTYIKSCECK